MIRTNEVLQGGDIVTAGKAVDTACERWEGTFKTEAQNRPTDQKRKR